MQTQGSKQKMAISLSCQENLRSICGPLFRPLEEVKKSFWVHKAFPNWTQGQSGKAQRPAFPPEVPVQDSQILSDLQVGLFLEEDSSWSQTCAEFQEVSCLLVLFINRGRPYFKASDVCYKPRQIMEHFWEEMRKYLSSHHQERLRESECIYIRTDSDTLKHNSLPFIFTISY